MCSKLKCKPENLIAVLCFDGIMFPTKYWENEDELTQDMRNVEKLIYNKTGIEIEFVSKPFENKLLNKVLEFHSLHNLQSTSYDHNLNNNQHHKEAVSDAMSTDEKENEEKIEDPPLTAQEFQQYIIKKLNEITLTKLHPKHPFRTINYCPNYWKPFQLIEEGATTALFKVTHLKQYRKLFYNFGNLTNHMEKKDHCNLCNKHVNPAIDTIERHIIQDCKTLSKLRDCYWIKAHNELADTYNKPFNTHQLKFGQYVLETIQKMNTNKAEFWKIASGANRVQYNKQSFKQRLYWKRLKWYTHHPEKHRNDQLYVSIIDKLAGWYKIAHDIALDRHKRHKQNRTTLQQQIQRFRQYANAKLSLNYHSWCPTKKDWLTFKRRNKITANDIIVGTDGSFNKTEEVPEGRAGYGIYIEHRGAKYYFKQALGQQTNNYAEITAIAKIPQLLKKLNLNPHNNKRIFILTDSSNAYDKALKRPHEKSDYPELHQQLLEEMSTLQNYTLIKVTSHLEDKRQLANFIENEEADQLAGDAASYSLENPNIETPDLVSWEYSSLTADDETSWKQVDNWDYMTQQKPPDNSCVVPGNIYTAIPRNLPPSVPQDFQIALPSMHPTPTMSPANTPSLTPNIAPLPSDNTTACNITLPPVTIAYFRNTNTNPKTLMIRSHTHNPIVPENIFHTKNSLPPSVPKEFQIPIPWA